MIEKQLQRMQSENENVVGNSLLREKVTLYPTPVAFICRPNYNLLKKKTESLAF
jgi:hypothetical protein